MMKPAADKARKNDRNDAVFLARMLAANNIVEVMVPDEECESMRDLSRLLGDARDDLARAKQRLTKFLLRHGHVFDERRADGRLKGNWTRDHWAWIRRIEFAQGADQDVFDAHISEVRHFEAHKKAIEGRVKKRAAEERWRSRVEALRCLKGIDTMTAFAIVVEAQVFSRFDNASAFAAWLGLVPSEHSSGGSSRKGGITKSGNSHLRRLLVEAAWHYANATPRRKERAAGPGIVPLPIENHAAKGTKRLVERRRLLGSCGKKPACLSTDSSNEGDVTSRSNELCCSASNIEDVSKPGCRRGLSASPHGANPRILNCKTSVDKTRLSKRRKRRLKVRPGLKILRSGQTLPSTMFCSY